MFSKLTPGTGAASRGPWWARSKPAGEAFMVFAAQAGALAFLFVSVAAAQSSRPVDPGEMKHAERLQTEAKGIDADAAKAMSPEGQQRITETIAKQFKVDPSVVTSLRNRRIGFGEATVALALSQEMMKQDKTLTQQRALDQILAKRAGGEGWGRIAQDLGVKLGRVRSEVERAEKKVTRLDRADKLAKDKGDKLEQGDKVDKIDSKPVRMDRPEKAGRSGR